MISTKATKFYLIAGAILLFVLLFIAPKTNFSAYKSKQEAGQKKTVAFDENANLNLYLNNATKVLNEATKSKFNTLVKQNSFDELITFWLEQKRPDLAAHFEEKKALHLNTDSAALKCGNRYYYSVQFVNDESEAPVLFACAAKMFKKALAINPSNFDAKLMLASCYVEAGNNPMEGIALLKELEKTDSTNIKLNLTFAFFSLKSGQTDKALQRFNKVIQLDSNNIEVYLHLADAHEKLGNTEQTILALKQYAKRTKDETAKQEIEKYIEQLKK